MIKPNEKKQKPENKFFKALHFIFVNNFWYKLLALGLSATVWLLLTLSA